jgi:hypothetical protein
VDVMPSATLEFWEYEGMFDKFTRWLIVLFFLNMIPVPMNGILWLLKTNKQFFWKLWHVCIRCMSS